MSSLRCRPRSQQQPSCATLQKPLKLCSFLTGAEPCCLFWNGPIRIHLHIRASSPHSLIHVLYPAGPGSSVPSHCESESALWLRSCVEARVSALPFAHDQMGSCCRFGAAATLPTAATQYVGKWPPPFCLNINRILFPFTFIGPGSGPRAVIWWWLIWRGENLSFRCGHNFCATHRYAEAHDCSYDYKSAGRRLLQEANPLISAPKLPKIWREERHVTWTVVDIRTNKKSFTTACFYFLNLSQVRLWSRGESSVWMDTERPIMKWICSFFSPNCLTRRWDVSACM